MIKQYRGGIVTFYLCAAAALIAAVFVDLKLDIILNNPHNPLAMWFCNTGEMPCRLVGTVAGVMIFYLAEKPAIKVFGFIVDLGASAYLGYHIARYFFLNEHMIIFGILYGLGVGVIALWLGKYLTALIPEEKWGRAHHWLIWHGRRICRAQRPLCGECSCREWCRACQE